MDTLTLTILVLAGSLAAGFVGALTGLGGGAMLTPLLVLVFGVDLRYAVGASLVAVIATSCGSAAAYVRDGYANVRVALLLEVATVFGALIGAVIAGLIPVGAVAVVFGLVMLWTSWSSRKPPTPTLGDTVPDAWATRLKLNSTLPTKDGPRAYSVHRVWLGWGIMFAAGILSAIAGIGSGTVKVLAMDRVMKLPFKVSTTTSNFMIGVTAAASAGVYLHRGQIDPGLAMPVALGALAGSFAGAKVLPHAKTKLLRIVFAIVVGCAGVQMIYKGVMGMHG